MASLVPPFRKGSNGSLVTDIQAFPFKQNSAFFCRQCTAHSLGDVKCIRSDVFAFVRCPTCDTEWHVCTVCTFSSIHKFDGVLSSRASVYRKHVNAGNHKSAVRSCLSHVNASLHSQVLPIEALSPLSRIRKRKCDRSAELDMHLTEHFGDTPLKEYLHSHLSDGGCGARPLIVRSLDRYGKDDGSWDPVELAWELRAAYIYFSMSRLEREQVAAMVYHYYNLGKRHEAGTGLVARSVPPPKEANKVRARYIRGPLSIANNLPIPKLNSSILMHTCLTLTSCVEDFLAHGTLYEPIPYTPRLAPGKSYSWITETPRAEEIRQDLNTTKYSSGPGALPVCILPYIVWQDDFEPNANKKRGSMWLQTVTVAPHRSRRNLPQQTYPMSLARSKDSHALSEALLLKDMRGWAKGPTKLFSLQEKAPMAVYAAPYAIICDQPERRKMTNSMQGTAKYHARFLHSVNHKAMKNVLRTCKDCLACMRGSNNSPGRLPADCKVCVNWDAEAGVKSKDPAIVDLLKLPIPSGYPMSHFGEAESLRERYITKDNRILPFKLSSSRLMESTELAYNNLVAGHWGNSHVLAFLERECLNTEFITEVQTNAANRKLLNAINDKTSPETPRAQDIIQRDFRANPQDYQLPPFPLGWQALGKDNDSLGLFVDVLMHLLFLGIVKSGVKDLNKWLTRQQLFTDFKERGVKLSEILQDLKLDWLPVLDFRHGTCGNWVSENYLAFSRIATWFYQEVPDLFQKDGDATPPSAKPNTAWRKPHYVHWLRVRGLPETGTVPEMKKRIIELLDQEGGPPEKLKTVAGEYTPSQVERVLVAMEEMIQIIMTPVVVPGVTLPAMEYRIKRFIAEYDLMDQQVQTDPNVIRVFNKSNFMCLLSLPGHTERFGPLRNLWEGSFKGEGFISLAKRYLHGGMRHNFHYHAMDSMLKDCAFQRSVNGRQSQDKNQPECWRTYLSRHTRSFTTYSMRSEVATRLNSTLAVSVVGGYLDGKKCFFVVCRAPTGKGFRDGLACYLVKPSSSPATNKMGSNYQEWNIGTMPYRTDASTRHNPIDNVASVVGDIATATPTFGILLPLIAQVGAQKHCLITRDRYSHGF